jgi:endonuclease/exonuclease/phosphatase family metal-dependent hydrolase
VNTHLGLDERERHWQMDYLLQHQLFKSYATLPTVIVGDFNDWRNTLGNAALLSKGFRQLTTPPSQFRSFPSWLPVGGLDKIFVSKGIQSNQARVVRTSLAREASDHLPVVVDFTISVR